MAAFANASDAAEGFTLDWFNDDDILVSTNRNDGDYQIAYSGNDVDGIAFLFVDGLGWFS